MSEPSVKCTSTCPITFFIAQTKEMFVALSPYLSHCHTHIVIDRTDCPVLSVRPGCLGAPPMAVFTSKAGHC